MTTCFKWAAVALALVAGCGGNGGSSSGSGSGGGSGGGDSPPVLSKAPQLRLTVAATEPFAGSYGSVGEYERLTGTIAGEVDPADPSNAIIQDLALAPVNANGMVEYSADFVMLKPKDMSKASGVLRYDAPNRGNILTC